MILLKLLICINGHFPRSSSKNCSNLTASRVTPEEVTDKAMVSLLSRAFPGTDRTVGSALYRDAQLRQFTLLQGSLIMGSTGDPQLQLRIPLGILGPWRLCCGQCLHWGVGFGWCCGWKEAQLSSPGWHPHSSAFRQRW